MRDKGPDPAEEIEAREQKPGQGLQAGKTAFQQQGVDVVVVAEVTGEKGFMVDENEVLHPAVRVFSRQPLPVDAQHLDGHAVGVPLPVIQLAAVGKTDKGVICARQREETVTQVLRHFADNEAGADTAVMFRVLWASRQTGNRANGLGIGTGDAVDQPRVSTGFRFARPCRFSRGHSARPFALVGQTHGPALQLPMRLITLRKASFYFQGREGFRPLSVTVV